MLSPGIWRPMIAFTVVSLVTAAATTHDCASPISHIHERSETGFNSYYDVCTNSKGVEVRLPPNHDDALSSSRRQLHLDYVPTQNAPQSRQSLLTVLCLYPGAALTATSLPGGGEAFWRSDTFNTTNSVHAAYLVSSYNKVGFDEAGSRFATATLNYAAPSDGSCVTATERTNCQAAAEAADSSLNFAAYDHVEYWMPYEFTCSWSGVAISCANVIGTSPNLGGSRPAGSCWSMTRATSTGTLSEKRDTRIHELGHNMGVSHATGYEAEYGDPTDVMGVGEVNTFSAAVRWQMGWLAHTQPTIADGATSVYNIRELAVDPSTASDGYHSIVAIRCPECLAPGSEGDDSSSSTATQVIGGTIIVSYRGAAAYTLEQPHRSAVHVHLAKRRYGNGQWTGGTSVYGILRPGASEHIEFNGLAITVCSVSSTHATVAFHSSPGGTSRTAAIAAATAACPSSSTTSPPPPPPPAPPPASDCQCERIVMTNPSGSIAALAGTSGNVAMYTSWLGTPWYRRPDLTSSLSNKAKFI